MSARDRSLFARWWVSAIVLATLGASACQAQTAFRRVFVPADAPQNWPTDGERYLPVDNGEFQKLLDSESQHSSARLHSAEYHAELNDDGVLAGSATYSIELTGDKPRILALEPLNLAVTLASWQDEDGPPVQSGLWNRAGEAVVWGVLVERSGVLGLDWHVSAAHDNPEILEFALDLPAAAPQTFEISLPADYQAVMPSAELVGTQAESDTRQRWLFQLPSHGPHLLRLLRQSTAPPAPRSSPRLSQATVYHLDPAGLDLSASFRVEPHDALVELRLKVTADVRIKSVAVNRAPGKWRLDETQPGGALVIDLPAAVRAQEVEIEALAPVTLDRAWRLPTIRAANAQWTEGTSLVVVSPRLELKSFSAESATLEHIVGLQPEAASTEAYRVQEWSSEASIEVVVSRLRPRLSVESATAIDLGAGEATARITARLTSELQPTYRVAAELAEGWSIESVTTAPAAALREWHLADNGERVILELQLSEPIQPGAPLRVEFDARESRDAEMPGTIAELEVLRFAGATAQQKKWVLLRSQPQRPMELLNGLESARVLPGDLTPNERALLPEPVVGELLDLSGAASGQEIAMRPRAARFEVEVQAELVMQPQLVTQRYEIECRPVAGEVSEVEVRFDRPLPATAEWLLFGDGADSRGRRLEPELQAGAAEDRPVYVVRLPFESPDPVRLAVSYSIPAEESSRYNAISFPQAERWTGRLDIRGPLQGLALEDAGWTPVGWSRTAEASSETLPLVSSYRLDSDQSNRATPLIVKRSQAASDAASLAAWLAEYESHQAADGAAICSAVYFLEDSGATDLEFELPVHAELQAVWLNGEQLAFRDFEVAPRNYRIRLAHAERFLTLALQYVAHGPPLGRATAVRPVLPETSFPVKLSRWTLWTPEQFVPDDSVTGYSARRIPWRERLFGPLARSVGQEVFLPWRADAWPRLWSAPVKGLRTRLMAERIASRLEQQLASAGQQTWGQLLTDIEAQFAGEDVISLDAVALETAGIEARIPTGTAPADLSIPTGRQLASHALAFVVSPNRILITTSGRVAHWRQQLQPMSAPRVFAVAAEELTQEIEAKSTQTSSGIVAIEDWASLESRSAPPWDGLLPPAISDVGQRACTIEFISSPPTVVVRRAYAEQAYWYVAWLAAVVGGTWWLGRRADRFALGVTMAAAACFVAPASWLALPQAVLVGLLSALLLRLVFSKTLPSAVGERSTQTFVPRTAILAALLSAMLGASEACGARAIDPLHQVLVPIDAAGNRQGSDVYVSQSHLDALHEARGSADRGGARYAITNALVRGDLPSRSKTESEPWTITLRVESFLPSIELELPIRQSDGEWLGDLASIDGKPALLTWSTNGEGCRVHVEGVGPHELKLIVRPRIVDSPPRAQVRLNLPKLPGTRLELVVSDEMENVHIAGSGRIVRDTRDLLRTDLADGSLLIDWTANSQQSPLFVGDLEQLSWLRIEPSVGSMTVQFRFQDLVAPRRTLDLEVPSELKLLPPALDSPVERIEALSKGLNRLHMKPGWEANGRVPLEFQLQRTSSLGRFFYPNVRLHGHTPQRRLLGVSVSEGLSYQEELGVAVRSISPTEFTTAWGETDRLPTVVYSLPGSSLDWSLRVWPEAPQFSAQQSLALRCQSEGARVEYRALVNQVAGKVLVHELRIPAEMAVDDVTVADEAAGAAASMRWSRPQDDRVAVFLSGPLSRPHVVRLTGRMRAAPDGTLVAPQIMLVGAERGESRIAIWRDPQVLASWVDPATAPRELARPLTAPNSSEILVGRYAWSSEERAGERRLRLRGNDQQFTADRVVSIEETAKGRLLKLHARLRVLAGVLGQVQIRVPADLAEPFEIQPAGIGALGPVQDGADGRRVTLVFHEPLAAGSSIDLRFAGRLTAATDGRVEVPALEVLGAVSGNRYILLPTRLNHRPLEWQIAGLKREPLPEALRHFGRPGASELPYRVVGSQFTAREPIYQGPLRSAALRHAWVEGVLDGAGNLSATASFVLQPGRATHCLLRLPTGARLLQIVADEQLASRQQLADGTWRVALGPPFLPRVIKVSFVAHLSNDGPRVRLAPPEVLIGDAALPLPATDWQISLVDGERVGAATLGAKISGAKYAEARHQALVSALKDAATVALESPEAEVRPWFAAWRDQVEAAAESVSRRGLEPVHLEFEPALDAEITSWTQLTQKMTNDVTNEESSSANQFEYPPALSQRPSAALEKRVTYLSSNAAGQIEIVRAPLAAGGLWRWVAAAVILALGLTVERHLQARPEWIEALRRWPHALAFGAGLVWWTLFAPSVVGLVIMLLAATSWAVEFARQRSAARPRNTSTQPIARMS